MKGLKTAKALSEIDEEYIIEALPEKRIKVTVFPWKYIALASSFALVVCIGIMAILLANTIKKDDTKTSPNSQNENEYEKVVIKPDDNSSKADIAKEKPWAEKNNSERFPEINGISVGKFVSTNTVIPKEKINFEPQFGLLNAFAEMKGVNTDTFEEVKIKFLEFAIKGINYNYAMAVQFEGDDNYYAYVNCDLQPLTFKEFADGLDLKNTISFGQAYYEMNDGRTIRFEGLDKNRVYDILFNDTSSMTATEDSEQFLLQNGFNKRVSISTSIELLGYKNLTISLSDDGYLFTNLLGKGRVFHISKENVQRLKSYLTSSCKGYELVYENSDTDTNSNSTKKSDDSSTASKFISANTLTKKYPVLCTRSTITYEPYQVAKGVYFASGATISEDRLNSDSDQIDVFSEEVYKQYDGNDATFYYGGNGIIYIGEDGNTYFRYSCDTSQYTRANRKTIEGIPSKIAYAIQFKNAYTDCVVDDKWYVYVCEDSNFTPRTLYEYAHSIGLDKYASYSCGGKSLDKNKVWEILFENGEKIELDERSSLNSDEKYIELSVKIDILGASKKTIKVTEDGYLYADIVGRPMIFKVGKEAAQKLKEYTDS